MLLLVINCSSFSSGAQTSTFSAENKLDDRGAKDGPWRKLDSTGKVQYEGQFRHGVPFGEFRYFYPTGKIRIISQVTDEGNTAKTINFHPNGMKMAEGTYINKRKEGEWTYNDENGILVSREFYAEGKKSGLASTYYSDGKLFEEKHYEHGLEVGSWKQFFTDGALKIDAVYEAGKIEGMATFYFPDGKVMARGNYVHNLKHGVWTFMSEDGKKEKEDIYEMGRLVKTVNYDPKPDDELKK
jgi:antitoxin component YwqK of YwqJK toxin-antitoxin module